MPATFHQACVIVLLGVQVVGCQIVLAHVLLSKVVKPKLDPEGQVSHRNEKNLKKDFTVKVVSFTLIIYVAFLAL